MARTIVLFGESITAGADVPKAERWSSLLEARLNAAATGPYRVVNAGRRGETTVTALSRMDREVVERRPDLVVVQFGLDDGSDPVKTARPPVERAAFDANLRRIALLLRERTTAIVTFLTNHPFLRRVPPRSVRPMPAGSNPASNAVIRQVAYELNAPLLDLHGAFRAQDVPLADLLAPDGVHLSLQGHWLYAACVAPFIQRLL
jgi:lysophospholipase L1-like esterase